MEGDLVEYRPIAGDEIYIYEMPEVGTQGKITKLSIDSSFLVVWGIVLPVAEVEFATDKKMIYLEDLKLIAKCDT